MATRESWGNSTMAAYGRRGASSDSATLAAVLVRSETFGGL